jgi:hypothetical protein
VTKTAERKSVADDGQLAGDDRLTGSGVSARSFPAERAHQNLGRERKNDSFIHVGQAALRVVLKLRKLQDGG